MKTIYWIVFLVLCVTGVHDVFGQPPPHPSVSINWTYPPATGITFNVYRRQCPYVSGVPTCAPADPWTKLNTSAVTQKTYLDTAVVMGATYEYGVTATDGVQESAKTTVAAAIPIDGVSGLQATPQ